MQCSLTNGPPKKISVLRVECNVPQSILSSQQQELLSVSQLILRQSCQYLFITRDLQLWDSSYWVCHNLRINNWNFNRPMTVILSRQLSNSWCLCQQHVKTIWLKFGKLFSTSIQGLLDWVPLSFSVETFSLSVENIFLSPQKKVCSRSWVSWMISIFIIMIRCKQSQVRVCGGNENKIKDREMLTSQRVKFHWEMGFPRCLATLCPLLYLRQWSELLHNGL